MTSIRVQCPTPGCEAIQLVLEPRSRPGMLSDDCTVCGKAWRMKNGELIEVDADPTGQ